MRWNRLHSEHRPSFDIVAPANVHNVMNDQPMGEDYTGPAATIDQYVSPYVFDGVRPLTPALASKLLRGWDRFRIVGGVVPLPDNPTDDGA